MFCILCNRIEMLPIGYILLAMRNTHLLCCNVSIIMTVIHLYGSLQKCHITGYDIMYNLLMWLKVAYKSDIKSSHMLKINCRNNPIMLYLEVIFQRRTPSYFLSNCPTKCYCYRVEHTGEPRESQMIRLSNEEHHARKLTIERDDFYFVAWLNLMIVQQ